MVFVLIQIAVELLFFQDCANLKRLLPTIVEHVDLIFAVDGRHWLDEKYYKESNDGSRELLSSYDNVELLTIHNYEYVKRQRIANLCLSRGFNDLMIIDSDEYVLCDDWEIFKQNWKKVIVDDVSNYGLYKAQIQRLDSTPQEPIYSWQPILWHKPWEFIYQGRHDYFKRTNETSTNYIKSYQNVEGIKLNHDHLLRTQEHMNMRLKQLEWQQKVDKPL